MDDGKMMHSLKRGAGHDLDGHRTQLGDNRPHNTAQTGRGSAQGTQ